MDKKHWCRAVHSQTCHRPARRWRGGLPAGGRPWHETDHEYPRPPALRRRLHGLCTRIWPDALLGSMVVLALLPACTALQGILRAVMLWGVVALACNSRRVLLACLLPAVMLMPGALYYISISGVPPGYPLWLILFYCSLPVVKGYIGPVLPYLCAWMVLWGALVALYCLRPRGPVVRWRSRTRLACMGCCWPGSWCRPCGCGKACRPRAAGPKTRWCRFMPALTGPGHGAC
ncbi:hypothetical protein RAA17_00960 [Komagataeibacter rhaeticus]|nr:hypothetical protein [Komagataeibacter rhaeticus]